MDGPIVLDPSLFACPLLRRVYCHVDSLLPSDMIPAVSPSEAQRVPEDPHDLPFRRVGVLLRSGEIASGVVRWKGTNVRHGLVYGLEMVCLLLVHSACTSAVHPVHHPTWHFVGHFELQIGFSSQYIVTT